MSEERSWAQVYYSALSGLTHEGEPVPVNQNTAPGDPDTGRAPDTYVTFNQAEEDYVESSSDLPRRTRHLVQVHFVSLRPEAVRPLMKQARTALRAAGIRPRYCAALMHEEDTGYWHLPMYTWYLDKDV